MNNSMINARNVLLVILLSLAIPSVYAQQGSKIFEFDDFFKNNTFSSRRYRGGEPMNDGEHYLVVERNGQKLVKYSYSTGEPEQTLFDLSSVPDASVRRFSDFTLSNDETRVLLLTQREAIYRRSFLAQYYVYDIRNKSLRPLSDGGKQRVATFSPDGTKIAFVRDNNLFYTDLENNKEVQVTTDGEKNKVINGVPDWVYEEEFGFNQAYEWSPDNKYLAWIRFDESKVPQFSMTLFQGSNPSLDEYKLYPGVATFKYPKAGDPNSVVSVYTLNLSSGVKNQVETGKETDIYIPRIRWTQDPGKLSIFRLNRHQNHFEILFADPSNGNSKVIFTEDNKYYVDENILDEIRFLEDGKHFSVLSEKDGWSHIYLYNMDGTLANQITKGSFDVLQVNGFDTEHQRVYYTSAEPTPYQRRIYSVSWDGTGRKQLSLEEGVNSVAFSKGFKYYTLSRSNSETPAITSLYQGNGKLVRVLDNNKSLTDKLKDYKFNLKEFFSFTNSEGVKLYGWMVKPPDFDPGKKYPVFLKQYSGPNSQTALDQWELGWENYIAQSGYIIACVDGRGTGGRGEAFRKVTYMQLGKYETIDQIETAKYLGTIPFVDAKRIGIWGWSFGGYISSSCMVKGNGIFKAAIAVAPVTNWRYYDNIYTERFMRTPQENPEGYDQNSPLYFADSLRGKLLLCHGTADDNVHFQNTAEFAERLVQANKQFEMQVYTNRNHGISGGNTTYHLYTRMTEFLLKNL